MARKKSNFQNEYPYHVFNRAIDKKFFEIPMKELWELFCHQAYSMSVIWNGKIHAAVLMHNHFHLVISTPDSNLGVCMQDFQSEVARGISRFLGSDGYRFSGRYKWSIIETEIYYRTLIRYVYQNPVRAGLETIAQKYPYSTLSGIVGETELKMPVIPHSFAPDLADGNSEVLLPWVNEIYMPRELKVIRSGFRGAIYSPRLSKTTAWVRMHLRERKIIEV